MARPSRHSAEVRERAVRLVQEHRDEYPSEWAAICSIAPKFGVTSETLRAWLRRAQVDQGQRPGHDQRGIRGAEAAAAGERGTQACQRDPEVRGEFLRGGARPPTHQVIDYIDQHKDRFGVEPICAVLRAAGVSIAPSTYYAARSRPPSARARRDAWLCEQIMTVWKDNYQVYGAQKVWHALRRRGIEVARCTVQRLMRRLGITGATRGKARRTTIPAPTVVYGRVIWSSASSPHSSRMPCG
jgi:transposase-like protein